MPDDDRLELLGQVAVWYYEENVDQSAIAQRIGKSRSMVSRMLQEARDLGLVEVRVTYPLRRDRTLETHLCRTFGLADAVVLATALHGDYDALTVQLGKIGARYLQAVLRDGIGIGIGWGVALHRLVTALPDTPLKQASVVQIMGTIGHGDPMIDGSELSRWLATKLQAEYRFLYAPLFVESEATAQSLLQQPAIADVLTLARQVDVALVGIGVVEPSRSGLFRTGYFTDTEIVALRAQGVVGDLMGHLLDSHGNPVDIVANRHIIGESLAALQATPLSIGIAGGVIKAPAILAVLRGGYLNTLITDAEAATAVLSLHAQTLV